MVIISLGYLLIFKKTAVLSLKGRSGLSFPFSKYFPVSSGRPWSTTFLVTDRRIYLRKNNFSLKNLQEERRILTISLQNI